MIIKLIALGVAFFHRWHVHTLFENDRHFSHLSEIEREMSFRTEMGMYYSYYKMIAEAKTFSEGLQKISNDNLSEHGNVINAARKYSLLPEIVIGTLYYWAKHFGLVSIDQCWQIERGPGIPPVRSCEGLGIPVYFYLELVWTTPMYTAAVLFYYSVYLGNSVFSGIVSILLFFYNHDECTRVQWTPPLRESFGYPMLLIQMYRMTVLVDKYAHKDPQKRISKWVFLDICFFTVISLCSWQFSHFVFTTQIVALLILKWMKIISADFYTTVCVIHVVSTCVAACIIGPNLLSSSLYVCLLLASRTASFVDLLSGRLNAKLRTVLEIVATIVLTKFLKSYVMSSDTDEHVFNLLRSKLSDYRDFHTMLYTCSAEFDFLQYRTFEVIIKTLLLPSAVLTGTLALYFWYRSYKTKGYPMCIEPKMAYNGLQTGAFIIMAIFIMRLKLFMNPHLCIMAGSVCAKRYLEKVGLRGEIIRIAAIGLLIAGMSYHGIERFREERSIIGEYSNIEQEELFEWIKSSTTKEAVFAGKMSLMANLMLSTGRPIVNNPYYESKEMRDRTLKVYEVFGRKDATSVYVTLKNMSVDYVVLEEPLCLGIANLRPGCQMIDLWDMLDNGAAKAAGRPPLCPILFQGNAYPFKRAFVNKHYVVLQLDYSLFIELKPKIPVTLYYKT